jgi:Protein of unknown function (DUF1444)
MHRSIIVTAILTAAALGCSQPSAERAFTERVAAQIRDAAPGSKVTVTAPMALEVRDADGTPSVQRLDNLYRQCTNHPDTCESSTARLVRTLAERQSTQSMAEASRVLATVRDRPYLDEAAKQGLAVVARPFVGDLWKVYVVDLPDAMRLVGQTELKQLKLTPDQLDALALANLARRINDFSHRPEEDGSPVRVLHVGDSYESARLLLHDRWRDLQGEVKGDLLVSAPSRDYVFFVGSGESAETLRDFRAHMEELAGTEPHPLSPQILRWTPRGWIVHRD